MNLALKLAALLIVPLVRTIFNAIEDARDERIEKRRRRAIADSRAKELEAERQDELRRQERKMIRQTKGTSATPVPHPDDMTPVPPRRG